MLTHDGEVMAMFPASRWLERPMSWLRPEGPRGGREAYQLRFLTGAITLATVVSVLALGATAVLGKPKSMALIGGYLVLILLQAAAVRLGAAITTISWTVLTTVGLFLVACAIVPNSNPAGQLYWFLLIPLAARALDVQRHDAPPEQRSWRAELIAGAAALVALALVIAFHPPRPAVGAVNPNAMALSVGLDVALFLISALGLLYVHDLSVRETAAELRRLQQLLAICAWCRKINYSNEWVALEQYMALRQNVELTHGMCPTCCDRHFPGELPRGSA
jgi:hypothetical protein